MAEELVIIFFSLVILMLGIKSISQWRGIDSTGVQAEAVVFSNNYKASGDGVGLFFPVLRFMTTDDQWITTELKMGCNPKIPEGTKMHIVYDPEDPQKICFQDQGEKSVLSFVLIIFGVAGLVFGILEYLEYIDLLGTSYFSL